MNPPSSDDDTRFGSRDSDALVRLRELFNAAVELPRAAQAAWLAAHVSDPGDKAALLGLLAADGIDNGLLDTPVDAVATRLGTDDMQVEGLIGQLVGAFRLTRLLGKGGMAAVFLGEREQDNFRQQVAIKLLRRGLYSPIEQRLFLRERQVLASLAHTNIARLFDGGVTDAGIPFLVMEYVDGEPITRFATARGLGIRERLELILVVCWAVEAAHRALVVHRDIKPANILVSGDGTVKLLDFGIAKLLEDDVEGATVGVFTPGYAAPEQIRSGPITTATDVYALGVLLHELLLGVRPQGEPPRRPSALAGESGLIDASASAASPHQLRRALQGDLDNIVLKALSPEPEMRYASAGALADDIGRYLGGQPVVAHPPSGWYRTRKFVSRHKGGVATTLAFVLVILAALGMALWQADIARREAHRANTVRDFVESMFDPLSAGTIKSRQPSYSELLSSSVDKLEQDQELGPTERIDLLLLFARLTEKIGEYDKAQALADRASRFADQQLAVSHPLRIEARVESGLIAEHHGLAEKAHANLAQGEHLYRSAGIRGMPMIRLYDGLSALADDDGDANNEVRYARLGLDETRATFSNNDRKIGSAYHNLGFALETKGDFREAADAYRLSYAMSAKELAPDSFQTAVSLATLGNVEGLSGQLRQGRTDILKARSILSLGTGKPRDMQAANAGYLCTVETAMFAPEAKESCADALRLSESVYGKGNASYALTQRLQGVLQLESGDFGSARAMLEASAQKLATDATRSWRGRTEINLGELDWLEDRPNDALRTLQNGIDDLGAGYPPTLRRYGLAFLALVCSEAPNAGCAANTYERATREIAATSYAWSAVLLPAQIALARTEIRDRKPLAAIERLRQAIAHAKPQVNPQSLRLFDAQLWLAIALARAGDCAAARQQADAVRTAMATAGSANSPLLGDVRAESKVEPACKPRS